MTAWKWHCGLILIASLSISAQTLPNHKLTPGAIRTRNAKEICSPKFHTKPYRKTTLAMKREVCTAYHVKIKCPGPAQEIDHLVPLELGGMDAESNLWPQSYPAAHQKDLVENRLHKMVCGGTISLEEAQRMLMTDWYAAYKKLGFVK
jgi:5-methylcytosine-specific restriction endonuclease McrA